MESNEDTNVDEDTLAQLASHFISEADAIDNAVDSEYLRGHASGLRQAAFKIDQLLQSLV